MTDYILISVLCDPKIIFQWNIIKFRHRRKLFIIWAEGDIDQKYSISQPTSKYLVHIDNQEVKAANIHKYEAFFLTILFKKLQFRLCC